MLSISKRTLGQIGYYLLLVQDAVAMVKTAAADYYLHGGEPAGVWYGGAVERLGLSRFVNEEQLTKLTKGFHPTSRQVRALAQNAGWETRVGAFDFTFSVPKSVSVLWANAPADQQHRISQLTRRAVQEVIDYVQDNLASTRTRNKKGEIVHHKVDLAVALFEHGTSRSLDPQLHVHALVMNVGIRPDGHTGSLVHPKFFDNKFLLGALFQLKLAELLREEYGLAMEQRGGRRRWFELTDIPEKLRDHFSTRRKQIEKHLKEQGYQSAEAAALAALQTRPLKEVVPPRKELSERWRQESQRLGFTADEVQKLLTRPERLPKLDVDLLIHKAFEEAVDHLEQKRSSFPREELLLQTVYRLQASGVPMSRALRGFDRLCASSPRVRTVGQLGDLTMLTTDKVWKTESRLLASVEKLKRKHVLGVPERALNLAMRRVNRRLAKETGHELNDEQRRAVEHLTAAGPPVRTVTGFAGTGKTTMLRATREVLEQAGFRVIGAASTHQAHQELSQGAGIESKSLASRLMSFDRAVLKRKLDNYFTVRHEIRKLVREPSKKPKKFTRKPSPGRLDAHTVIVLDEASMADSYAYEWLLKHVRRSGARLLLVGDDDQLPSIGPGGAFGRLLKEFPPSQLVQITRQREEWSREAVKLLARGEAEEFLRRQAMAKQLFITPRIDDAQVQLIRDWRNDGGVAQPDKHVIAAFTNAEVDRFNAMAQDVRLRAGELSEHERIEVFEEQLYVGDRVTFQVNAPELNVFNADAGTVVAVNNSPLFPAVAVRLDGPDVAWDEQLKQRMKFEAEQLLRAAMGTEAAKRPATFDPYMRIVPLHKLPEHERDQPLRLGYAQTVHKLQGATVDHLYAMLGDQMTSRELSYVQASRHREMLNLYTSDAMAGEQLTRIVRENRERHLIELAEPLDSPLVDPMSRSQKELLAHDLEVDEPYKFPELTEPPRPAELPKPASPFDLPSH